MLKDDPLGNSYIVHVAPLRLLDLNSQVGQEAMEEERQFVSNGLPTMKRFTQGNWSKRVDTRARVKTVRIDCSPQKQEGCFLYEQYLVRLVTIVKYCENVSVRAKASMDGITVI